MKGKNIVLSMALLLLCSPLWAQFELTKDGLVDAQNPQNNYIVELFPGKTQQELFDICLANVEALRETENFIFQTEPNESITVTQYVPNVIWNGSLFGTDFLMDINYTITFRFREGRARVDSPVIHNMIYREPVEKNGRLQDKREYHWITQEEANNSSRGGKSIYGRNGNIRPNKTKMKESIEAYMNTYVNNMLSEQRPSAVSPPVTTPDPDEW